MYNKHNIINNMSLSGNISLLFYVIYLHYTLQLPATYQPKSSLAKDYDREVKRGDKSCCQLHGRQRR